MRSWCVWFNLLPLSLSKPHTAPTVFIRPLDSERTLSILLGRVGTLFCDVSSDPGSLLNFSWTKDDQPLDIDGARLVYVDPTLSTNGSIQITRVAIEDVGVYVCTVTTTYNGLPAPIIATSPIQVTSTYNYIMQIKFSCEEFNNGTDNN